MTDIEVLERQMECVRRKAKINCTNCGSCDLLMDDSRILAAYSRAIDVLRAKKHGRWVVYDWPWYTTKCSECGTQIGAVKYRYCPRCGAKMDADGRRSPAKEAP